MEINHLHILKDKIEWMRVITRPQWPIRWFQKILIQYAGASRGAGLLVGDLFMRLALGVSDERSWPVTFSAETLLVELSESLRRRPGAILLELLDYLVQIVSSEVERG